MSDSIAQIAKLNKQILKSASDADWDQVAEQAHERHQIIEGFFQSPKQELIKEFIKLNEKVKDTDQKVQQIIQQEKQQAIRSSLNLRNVQTALKAYCENHNFQSN